MKKMHWFLKLLLLAFICFIVVYIADTTGYYAKSIHEETVMTEKAKLRFEKDIADGKVTSLEDYLPKEKNYANVFTKSANRLEKDLGVFFRDDLKSFWIFLRSLFIS